MIEILDTTLRDGSQGEGVNFSAVDKLAVARRLAEFGIPLIEGGWPGSNPRDQEFFQQARQLPLGHSQLVAFGATRRKGVRSGEDASVQALAAAETTVVTLFGKSWTLHVREALGASLEENLAMIGETVAYLHALGRRVIYDAEHFFDGYKAEPDYALATLGAAAAAGADTLVLCDTNGGSLPEQIAEITGAVKSSFRDFQIGIHAHNDSGLAVANSLAAIRAGASHLQGTINGYGERCGNANLTTLIATLILKYQQELRGITELKDLAELSRYVDERANLPHDRRASYVGEAAFAHKGGVHVSAVSKNPRTYEHIEPEQVGNTRRVLVSDLAGRSNLMARLAEAGVKLSPEEAGSLLSEVKALEHVGYAFEAAEASFFLLLRKLRGFEFPFRVRHFAIIGHGQEGGFDQAEATVEVEVKGERIHSAAFGDGPVHALDSALRRAVIGFYPELSSVELADYKVRVLAGPESGTASAVRVSIELKNGTRSWGTVGAGTDIIAASLRALVDGYSYALLVATRELGPT
jgi:2-isopropylmalate synthase